MKDRIVSAFRFIDERARALGRRVQTAVVYVSLFFIYLIGIGLTKLLVLFFFRKYLEMFRPHKKESYWIDARGYNADEVKLSKQT